MTGPTRVELLVRRERAIMLTGLAALCLLAWAYVLSGAGMEHAPAAAPMPGMDMAAGTPVVSPRAWLIAVVMWATMMVAMMIPSAAPAILLYARVARQPRDENTSVAGPAAFAGGYLLLWLGFSLAAASLQMLLLGAGWLSPQTLGLKPGVLSAAVLALAGLYQLAPLHELCLTRCRSPAAFLSAHWRPGVAGALRLGALHGAYCVGCCWALMALLFVGGVMNLVWIAALTAVVAAEKLLGFGPRLGRGVGVALLAAAAFALWI